MSRDAGATGIAIIGMACRLPCADSPAALWRNLRDGVESITFFEDAELLAAGVEAELLSRPDYVKAAPLIRDADAFDAAFFGYSPREATVMDPQQRVFLEVAWEALEDAGYHPARCPGVVGVFAGGGGLVTSYFAAHPGHPALIGQTASLEHLGNDKDFLATRVSYKLDLTGPSVTVQTACSTSLVAVHLACQSLLVGECDMVLAGASTVRIPQVSGYLAQKGQVNSPDGHCRAFDASARGTIFGSGVVAVVLKRLADALAARDHVWAVIRGTALSNDGGRKMSYTAPSVIGQARAMVEALTVADVDADTIRYVECHATGTPVGDPLEIQALTRAWGEAASRRGSCAVGSVKTNIGHPEQDAGLAGLVKAALALRHGEIPPSLHCETPNPAIDFGSTPFYVNTRLAPWPDDGHPRRAAVNSLGIGGTNGFVVLEEAPAVEPAAPARAPHTLTLSARSDAALAVGVERFREFLAASPHAELEDIAYTSNVSRSQYPHRVAVTAHSIAELRERLAVAERSGPRSGVEGGPRVAFLFTGQGGQYPGMAVDLYRAQPVFRDALDRCDARLRADLGHPIVDVLMGNGALAGVLDRTAVTQPVTFAVEYALACLWQAWGVIPAAVLGHSLGELAACCVAGAMELEDALGYVAARGRLMGDLPGRGAMAAVFAEEARVREVLIAMGGQVEIAALNAPTSLVISGPADDIAEAVRRFEARGLGTRPLALGHGFHSSLVEPILDALETAARRVAFGVPRVPLVSNVTGALVETAPSARYLRDHARQPVRFADGLATLGSLGCDVFLEVGPGNVLTGLGRQVLTDPALVWMPSLGRAKPDAQSLADARQALYLAGVDVDWERVHTHAPRRRVALPTYPFQRHRFWIEATPRAVTVAPRPVSAGEAHQNGKANDAHDVVRPVAVPRPSPGEWFHRVRWVELPPPAAEPAAPGTWLVLLDRGGVGEALAARLERQGHRCHLVRPGAELAHVAERHWTADSVRTEHYQTLLSALALPLRGAGGGRLARRTRPGRNARGGRRAGARSGSRRRRGGEALVGGHAQRSRCRPRRAPHRARRVDALGSRAHDRARMPRPARPSHRPAGARRRRGRGRRHAAPRAHRNRVRRSGGVPRRPASRRAARAARSRRRGRSADRRASGCHVRHYGRARHDGAAGGPLARGGTRRPLARAGRPQRPPQRRGRGGRRAAGARRPRRGRAGRRGHRGRRGWPERALARPAACGGDPSRRRCSRGRHPRADDVGAVHPCDGAKGPRRLAAPPVEPRAAARFLRRARLADGLARLGGTEQL